MEIKFLDFSSMHQSIRKEVLETFEQFYDGHSYVLGQNLDAFEKAYADFCGTRYCVGVANGLDALVLCLKVLNIGVGDEVIVPSNTYIATWLAVSRTGAVPVPVDPRDETCNIDPGLIEDRVTSRTKAILPVHLYGQPAEMDALVAMGRRLGVAIVEDNAQAQGALYNGRRTGSFGMVNATSFYPGKNLGALGDGGAVTTQSEDLAQRIASLRNYGFLKKNFAEEKGINSRLDEIQAAFLSIKLRSLDLWNNQRREIAAKYMGRLSGVGDVILPAEADGAKPVYHLYVIRSRQRDALRSFLQGNGIETLIHYPVPPHLQKAYADLGYNKGDFPLAEKIAATCLSLPVYPGLSDTAIDFISERIREFYIR